MPRTWGPWGLAQDRESGALDLLLRGGLSLATVGRMRFALAFTVSSLGLLAALSPAWLAGGVATSRVVSYLPPLLFCAVLGATWGPRLGQLVVVGWLSVALLFSLVWLDALSPLLFGMAPTAPPSRAVSTVLFLLGPVPLPEAPFCLSRRWELARVAAALLLFAGQEVIWQRFSIFTNRES